MKRREKKILQIRTEAAHHVGGSYIKLQIHNRTPPCLLQASQDPTTACPPAGRLLENSSRGEDDGSFLRCRGTTNPATKKKRKDQPGGLKTHTNLGPDLVSALTGLQMHNLAHFRRPFVRAGGNGRDDGDEGSRRITAASAQERCGTFIAAADEDETGRNRAPRGNGG